MVLLKYLFLLLQQTESNRRVCIQFGFYWWVAVSLLRGFLTKEFELFSFQRKENRRMACKTFKFILFLKEIRVNKFPLADFPQSFISCRFIVLLPAVYSCKFSLIWKFLCRYIIWLLPESWPKYLQRCNPQLYSKYQELYIDLLTEKCSLLARVQWLAVWHSQSKAWWAYFRPLHV